MEYSGQHQQVPVCVCVIRMSSRLTKLLLPPPYGCYNENHVAKHARIRNKRVWGYSGMDLGTPRLTDEEMVIRRHQQGDIETLPWSLHKHGTTSKEELSKVTGQIRILPSQPHFFAFTMPFRKFAMMQRFLHVGALDCPARGQPELLPRNCWPIYYHCSVI